MVQELIVVVVVVVVVTHGKFMAAVCNSTHIEISGAHNKCTAFKHSAFYVCDLEHSYNDGAS